MTSYPLNRQVDEINFQELNNLLQSNLACEILSLIETSEANQLYSKQITEGLNKIRDKQTSQASVSNYLKLLREYGLIERGKRTKAQYYKISYDGIYKFWRLSLIKMTENQLERGFPEMMEDLDELIEENREEFAPEGQDKVNKEEVLDRVRGVMEDNYVNLLEDYLTEFKNISEDNTKLNNFIRLYSQLMLPNRPNNLYQMYIHNLTIRLALYTSENENTPEELKISLGLLSSFSQIGQGYSTFEDLIQKIWN